MTTYDMNEVKFGQEGTKETDYLKGESCSRNLSERTIEGNSNPGKNPVDDRRGERKSYRDCSEPTQRMSNGRQCNGRDSRSYLSGLMFEVPCDK